MLSIDLCAGGPFQLQFRGRSQYLGYVPVACMLLGSAVSSLFLGG